MAVEAKAVLKFRAESRMAQFIEEEKKYPDNAQRKNFVFMAYPFAPAISQDDYNAVVKELQNELSLRLWYFLDEVTAQELMRKIWRAILRADLCIFDTTAGNANVAFELGLAVAIGRSCITLLKQGGATPGGAAVLDAGDPLAAEATSTCRGSVIYVARAESEPVQARCVAPGLRRARRAAARGPGRLRRGG